MRDDDDGEPEGLIEFVKELMNAAARLLVEVSGGFIGQEDRRLHHECSRQRDALLLAPRELARFMAPPIG